MVRKFNASQFRSQMRQAVRKAENEMNREMRKVVNDYNRKARSNQTRLQNELRRLNSSSTSTVTIRYSTSTRFVRTVEQRFIGVESAVESGRWEDPDNLLDLAEAEAADSVASLNRLLSAEDETTAELQATTLTNELTDISPELQDRWTGALFALNPGNPDAARHFCTSAREMLTAILDTEAPDAAVIAADANYVKTPNGGVSRRAKIGYCLDRRGNAVTELVEFVDADIDGVISLFDDFNHGTHGAAGRFPMTELLVLKERVEKAVTFIHRLVRG